VAEYLRKPEEYVMTALVPAAMTFGASDAPCALLELMSVGTFSEEQTRELSRVLCPLVGDALGVPTGRVYIEFTPAAGYLWGHDGDTFG
jgi:hypothetical protein